MGGTVGKVARVDEGARVAYARAVPGIVNEWFLRNEAGKTNVIFWGTR